MLGIHGLWLFILSGILLNITPGPDTAYIVGRSVQMGWRGGVAAALGISAGCLVHVFAAAVGLSALLAASSYAFTSGEMDRCGLSALHRRADAACAGIDSCNERRRGKAAAVASAGVLAGRLHQRAEPEGRAVLSRLPAAIRRRGCAQQGAGLHRTWADLHQHGHDLGLGTAIVAAKAASRVRRSSQAMMWINRALGGVFIYLGIRVAMLETR